MYMLKLLSQKEFHIIMCDNGPLGVKPLAAEGHWAKLSYRQILKVQPLTVVFTKFRNFK